MLSQAMTYLRSSALQMMTQAILLAWVRFLQLPDGVFLKDRPLLPSLLRC